MSGIETAAAIMGIAGAGVSISATLYDYASAANNAKEDMRLIADSIDTYSSVLETLGRQIETSQAVCSVEGLRLAVDLQRQSEVLFQQISEHIPSNTEAATLGQKLSWYFTRARVNFLLSQIEQLKATVSLLVQILILAQMSKSSKQQGRNVNISVNVVNAEIDSQFRRAENRVLQYHHASTKLAGLQIEGQQPVIGNALPWKDQFGEIQAENQSEDDRTVQSSHLLANGQPISMYDTNANSSQLVNMLLDFWTTAELDMESSSTTQENAESQASDSEDQTDSSAEEMLHTLTSATTVPSTSSTTSDKSGTSWWQRFRQSQKVKEDEQRAQKELRDQEKDLERREAQLQREQTLVERELKLQEAQKRTQADLARALVEKQSSLAESQKLKEESANHAKAVRELRSQEAQQQKSDKQERKDRREALRRQAKIERKRSPVTRQISSSATSTSTAHVSTTTLPSIPAIETAMADDIAPPPYISREQSHSSVVNDDRFSQPATLDQQDTVLGKTLDSLHLSKSARKERLREIRHARKKRD